MENENPFKVIFEQLQAMKKQTAAIRLRHDTLRQRLRLEATAKVDDPTHPFTEGQFFNVIRKYSECTTAIAEALGTVRGKIEAELILKAIAAFIEDAIKIGNELGCDFPHCH